MYSNVKNLVTEVKERRRAQHQHKDVTRRLDALALTELGYPPKELDIKAKRWFLYL